MQISMVLNFEEVKDYEKLILLCSSGVAFWYLFQIICRITSTSKKLEQLSLEPIVMIYKNAGLKTWVV